MSGGEESGRPSWAVLGPGRPSDDWTARRVEEEPARPDDVRETS